MRDAKLEPKRLLTVFPTVGSAPCLILIQAKKGASSGLVFDRPLYIYKDENKREYSDVFAKIYESGTIG